MLLGTEWGQINLPNLESASASREMSKITGNQRHANELVALIHCNFFDDDCQLCLINKYVAQWEEYFFPKTSVAIILFWLKWAEYLAVAGLNLLAQLSDRISPYGV